MGEAGGWLTSGVGANAFANRNQALSRAVARGAAAACVAASGCIEPLPGDAGRPESGLVYVFPGVDGVGWEVQRAVDGLRDAGVTAQIRIFDWQAPLDPLENLTDEVRNRRLAEGVAAELRAFRRARPGAPIDLVGYSGGGGMALFAAEALPDQVTIRRIVLVHAAVSPRYDLTRALAQVELELVNFYSARDWLILGVGTTLLGTIDRAYSAAAGQAGFDVEAAVPRPEQRGLVRQVEWTRTMITAGHWGGHLSIGAYEWNRRFVAPLVGAATE